jgi:hypothetical protein
MNFDNLEKEQEGYQHYTGGMGDFWYDPNEFEIMYEDDGDFFFLNDQFKKTYDYPIFDHQKWLHYIGENNVIDIPKGVYELKLFHNKEKRKKLTIHLPDSVEEVWFEDISDIEGLYIYSDSDNFKIAHLFLFSKSLKEVEIPNSVEEIGEKAFKNCISLKEIKLPSNLKILQEEVFSGCSALKKIELPDDVEEIEKGAFRDCSNLKEIKLPENLKEIGEEAFESTALKQVEIPSAEVIGECAFCHCRNLKEIKLPENLKEIGEKAFSNTKLEQIEIPFGVQVIRANTFEDCSNLKKIKLPENLKKIAEDAFAGAALEQIEIPSAEVIETGAFCQCSSLKEIKLPENLEEIGEYAFKGTAVEQIEIPSAVLVIEDGTFCRCSNLKEIKLPDNLRVIGECAFCHCPNLKEIKLPKNLKGIEKGAFGGCSSLKEIKLPENLERIREAAFWGTALEQIEIPSEVEEIGKGVFYGCSNLKEIKLPENLKEIGERAFKGTALEQRWNRIGNRNLWELVALQNTEGQAMKFDVCECIRNPEFKTFFQKQDLDVWELIQIILHAYAPMQKKREWLYRLLQTVKEEEKQEVQNMLDLVDICLKQIYQTGEAIVYREGIVYAAECMAATEQFEMPKKDIIGSKRAELTFHDDIIEMIKYLERTYMPEPGGVNREIYVYQVIKVPFDKKHRIKMEFSMTWFHKKLGIFNVYPDDEWLKQKGISEKTIDDFNDIGIRCKELPFVQGDRYRIKTPLMRDYVYGTITYAEYDGCGDGDYFFTPDGKDADKDVVFLEWHEIDVASRYAVYDWVERVKD